MATMMQPADDQVGFAMEPTAEDLAREAAYFARVDAAEEFASYIERMADELGDEPFGEWAVAEADTAPYDWDRAA